MSRIVRFHEFGGPEVLRIEHIETSPPGPGEVRIAVKAIGLNRAEEMFRNGDYGPIPFPSRIGYEAAGIIQDVGPGTNGFAPGDVVSVIPTAGGIGAYGTYGEVATVPSRSVVKHPASLSFNEAAAVWMQYVTAYGALVDVGSLSTGDIVVINAASSSVGLAAIQIANLLGATPVATSRTNAKREALLRAGAAHVIATQEHNTAAALAEITKGRGVRIVFDPVGGPAAGTFVEALAQGGIYILYGLLDTRPIAFESPEFLYKSKTVTTFRIGDLYIDDDRLERAKRFVLDGLESGALKPIIAKTFTLDEIVAAHRYVASNEQFGKIIVTV
jgi:NADPH2:quinone reductase